MLQNLEKEIDDVDAKIGDRWRLLDRDFDGKVTAEEVAVAAVYLKDTLGKEGIQELISIISKDSGLFIDSHDSSWSLIVAVDFEINNPKLSQLIVYAFYARRVNFLLFWGLQWDALSSLLGLLFRDLVALLGVCLDGFGLVWACTCSALFCFGFAGGKILVEDIVKLRSHTEDGSIAEAERV
ncbi:hypothetical protein Ancab_008660 [Ancistrocladus abbreviatus]